MTILHPYLDPHGGHLLPQTTDWSQPSSIQSYFLTLGFRRRKNGDFLGKLLHRRCPAFTGWCGLYISWKKFIICIHRTQAEDFWHSMFIVLIRWRFSECAEQNSYNHGYTIHLWHNTFICLGDIVRSSLVKEHERVYANLRQAKWITKLTASSTQHK